MRQWIKDKGKGILDKIPVRDVKNDPFRMNKKLATWQDTNIKTFLTKP